MKRQLLVVWAIWCVGFSLFSQTSIQRQEQFLIDAEAQMDSLRIVRDQWINQNAILTTQIQQTKKDEQRSYSEHRKLEKRLRQAQTLNGEIQQTEMEIQILHHVYQDSLQALISTYQKQLDEQLVLAQKASSDQERNQHLHESQKLLAQKTRWSHRIETPALSPTSEFSLTVTPWDNAASLQLKNEAMLDQEESVRHEIAILNSKILQLQDEENMRRKMAEMTSDMDLFSENEETMDRVAFSGHTDARNAGPTSTDWGAESNSKVFFDEPRGDYQSTPYVQQDPVIIQDKISSLNIDDQIKTLKQYRDRLAARADSLQSRAEWFENQAAQWLNDQTQAP